MRGEQEPAVVCLGAVAAWPEILAMLTRSTGKRSRLGLNQWDWGGFWLRWLGEGDEEDGRWRAISGLKRRFWSSRLLILAGTADGMRDSVVYENARVPGGALGGCAIVRMSGG